MARIIQGLPWIETYLIRQIILVLGVQHILVYKTTHPNTKVAIIGQ